MCKHKLTALLFAVLFVFVSVMPANAYEPLGSVTVLLEKSGKPAEGVELKIYKAAEKDGTLTAEFADSKVDVNGGSSALKALESFAKNKNIVPLAAKKSNAEGKVLFEELAEGIYMICQGQKTEGRDPILPFFAPVPLDGDKYVYTARPKMPSEPDTGGGPHDKDIIVEKRWRGDSEHPESITVRLCKNGVIYDEVELNESNNWSHRWRDLPASSSWEVKEYPVPEGYKSEVNQVNNKFIVINTEEPDIPTDEELIQTGHMKWHITALAAGGILLFACGWALTFLKEQKR